MIAIDDAVFAAQFDDRFAEEIVFSHEVVLVRSTAPLDAVSTVVEAAAERLMLVDETGEAHTADETIDSDLDTPSYYDVSVEEDAVRLYLDCKGVIYPPMGATLRTVLRAELEAGLPDATVTVPTHRD